MNETTETTAWIGFECQMVDIPVTAEADGLRVGNVVIPWEWIDRARQHIEGMGIKPSPEPPKA